MSRAPTRKAVEPEVEREFMRAMTERAGQSVLANLVGVAIIAAGCFFVPFGKALAIGLAGRILAIAITAMNTREMLRLIAAEAPLGRAVNRFALGMAFAGLTWGGLLWAIPPDQFTTLSATLVRLVVLTGVILVTLTAAPVPRVMFAYCGSFVLVSGTHLFSLSDIHGYLPLVVGVAIFVGIMAFGIGMTREAHRAAVTLVENRRMARVLATLNEELGAALDQADQLARNDLLTGLPNRLSFEEACAQQTAGRKGRKLHLLIVDLDHFKAINDSAGHAGGDSVLRLTGIALAEAVRGLPAGSIAARIGGEEFALLLTSVNGEGAAGFATLLCDRIGHVPAPAGYEGRVTASIGIAEWMQSEPLHLAMKRADEALYRAKSEGRNRAIVAPPIAA